MNERTHSAQAGIHVTPLHLSVDTHPLVSSQVQESKDEWGLWQIGHHGPCLEGQQGPGSSDVCLVQT